MKKKKYVKVDFFKFIRASIVLFFIMLLICLLFSKAVYSVSEISYKEKVVFSGDTLWEIAKTELAENDYFKNKNIRDVITEIKELNELEDSYIKEGQILKITQFN